jgi:hypothetical protein
MAPLCRIKSLYAFFMAREFIWRNDDGAAKRQSKIAEALVQTASKALAIAQHAHQKR